MNIMVRRKVAPSNHPRLLSLALEAKQQLHSARLGYLDGNLTQDSLLRVVAHVGSMKARALALHGEIGSRKEIDAESHADIRRSFGLIWSSVRELDALIVLSHRHFG